MILRKPYAFLIKHFKLMHIILTISMIYLIYRTEMMISFLNEYIGSSTSVIGKPIISSLYNIGVILLPVLILFFSIILLITMSVKEKPKLFYILMVISHIALIAVYIYAYLVFANMQKTIVDMRTIKALRDIFVYCILFQGVFSIVSLVRGVGFDIRKFDFGRDLQELEISASDSEEFEVDLDFDLNDKTRKLKRIIRYWKYKYAENKFIVRIIIGIIVAGLLFYGYSHFNIYTKTNSEGTNFSMNGFTLGVEKSYLLNTDYQGNLIEDSSHYLVVVDLNVKCNSTTATALKTGTVRLSIAGDNYSHSESYEGTLSDLGIVYKGQTIGNEYEHYLLVYEIPLNVSTSKMKLGFTNSSTGETAYVLLNPVKLIDKKSQTKEYSLGDTIDFSNSTLGNTTLTIDSYELRNKFTLNYRYCSSRYKNCIDSVEYLTPSLYNSNYDKTLLRLDLSLAFDENFRSEDIKDIYSLIEIFGRIEYEIDGQTKTQTIYLGDVKPQKVASPNSYYIEVYQEIKVADRIALVFQVRENVYRYYLK